MMKRFSEIVIKISRPKVLIIFAAAFIFIEIIFSQSLPVLVELTGGKSLLDMSIAYSADFAYEHLKSYQNAASVYFRIRLVDFFFPAIYAFMLSIVSVLVYRRKYNEVDNYRWVILVPFSAALFDYVENILLIALYRMLPARFDAAVSVLNVITILKFGLLALSVLLIITGALSILKGGDSGLIIGNKFKGKK
jgi:hypothetical protein